MLSYALFTGCNTPTRLKQYESASRAVLKNAGVHLVDLKEFVCCGYPLRNLSQKAFIFSAASNMAIAEREGLNILALCKCCFGTLKSAQHMLRRDEGLMEEMNDLLSERGLKYEGRLRIRHVLSALYHDIGSDTLKEKVSFSLEGLNVGAHYGCHALRPSKITRFDDPVAPTIFEELIKLTGAKNIQWDNKLECCGAPLTGINDELSAAQTKNKLDKAEEAGADFICTSCPYCQLQFDKVGAETYGGDGHDGHISAIVYTQLLGLSMGIDKKELGFDLNRNELDRIEHILNSES